MTDKKQTPIDPDIPLEPPGEWWERWEKTHRLCLVSVKDAGICMEKYKHPGPHIPVDRRQKERRQK